MNNNVSADLPNNTSLKPKVSSKIKFVPIIFLFLLLIVVGLYFFKGFNFIKKPQEELTKEVTNNITDAKSPFGELASTKNEGVADIYENSINQDPEYYIKLYDEYKMGEMGARYIYKGFDEKNMTLTLIEKNPETPGPEKKYLLSKDFLVVCTGFDISRYGLDFRFLTDTDKYNIASKSSSMTLDSKLRLISRVRHGDTSFCIIYVLNSRETASFLAVTRASR